MTALEDKMWREREDLRATVERMRLELAAALDLGSTSDTWEQLVGMAAFTSRERLRHRADAHAIRAELRMGPDANTSVVIERLRELAWPTTDE